MSNLRPRARYRPPAQSFFNSTFGAPRMRRDEAAQLESLADLLQHF
jgi:hypothetical protein